MRRRARVFGRHPLRAEPLLEQGEM
jgi:hypothetical protein